MSFSSEVDPDDRSTASGLAQRSTSSLSTAPTPPVDFGTRFTAWMVDACLLFGLQWVVVMVLSRQLQAAGMTSTEACTPDSPFICEGPSTALWVLLFVIVIVSTFGYHAWFDGTVGASPGKRVMGLRVVDAETGTSPVGIVRGLLRSVVRQSVWLWAFLFLGASPIAIDLPAVIWFVLFGASLGTLVWAAAARSARGWHDLAANTTVTTAVASASRSEVSS